MVELWLGWGFDNLRHTDRQIHEGVCRVAPQLKSEEVIGKNTDWSIGHRSAINDNLTLIGRSVIAPQLTTIHFRYFGHFEHFGYF